METYDIIGDIHGCYDEFSELATKLGYASRICDITETSFTAIEIWEHPHGRKLVSVGDMADRGPKNTKVLESFFGMAKMGIAHVTLGNHDEKLRRALKGNPIKASHGLQGTLDQIAENWSEKQKQEFKDFLFELPTQLPLDGGNLLIVHAGIRRDLIGMNTKRAQNFTVYGDVASGLRDERGYIIRGDWQATYDGDPTVVFGHQVVRELKWRNNTIDIDTGCVFGFELTALRWPERETLQVKAHKEYCEY